MNKTELIEKIAMRADLSKGKAAEALDAIVLEVTQALSKGEDVKIMDFGTFTVINRKSRNYRNPNNGKTLLAPSVRYPKFRVSKTLKDAVK
jgi:DNA-binding protein HU-beta